MFVEDKDGLDSGVVFSVNFSLTSLSPALPGRLGYFVNMQRFPSAADVFCHHFKHVKDMHITATLT